MLLLQTDNSLQLLIRCRVKQGRIGLHGEYGSDHPGTKIIDSSPADIRG